MVTKRSRKLSSNSHQKEIGRQLKGLWDRINEAFDGANPSKIAQKLELGRHAVYKWRDGKSQPTLENLIRIRLETNSSLDWLLTGEGRRGLSGKESTGEISPKLKKEIEKQIEVTVQPMLEELERQIAAKKSKG
jgi:transcriptional regulator with XRE-family HTH domain